MRKGVFNVLVGINLLREGLDIPEVSLVAILEADKEGYLRSRRSLIQTMGRAARNAHGQVILYADRMTGSMQEAIDEVNRRREIQEKYNKEHNINPKTVERQIEESLVDYEIEQEDKINKAKKNIEVNLKLKKKLNHLIKRFKNWQKNLILRKRLN